MSAAKNSVSQFLLDRCLVQPLANHDEHLLALCMNDNMERSEVKEGKIELKAACDGLFRVRSEALRAVNAIDELMVATIWSAQGVDTMLRQLFREMLSPLAD